MASSSNSKTISLISRDDKTFIVDEAVAVQSQTIRLMMEDDCTSDGFPLTNVSGETLSLVIDYCKKHAESPETVGETARKVFDESLKAWDAEFMKVDQRVLYDLLMASNYLEIKGLFNLVCKTVADLIKNKSPQQIREIFNIRNDFTPEEEEALRKENEWAFKGF